jgi:hypothetical protein
LTLKLKELTALKRAIFLLSQQIEQFLEAPKFMVKQLNIMNNLQL